MHLYKMLQETVECAEPPGEPWAMGKGPDEIIGMGGYQAAHARETTVKSSN